MMRMFAWPENVGATIKGHLRFFRLQHPGSTLHRQGPAISRARPGDLIFGRGP
jgi:hypothetical protein